MRKSKLMKLRQNKEIVATTIVFIVLGLSVSIFPASATEGDNIAIPIYEALTSVDTATTEYTYMPCRGDSMYPTIIDGDSVRVQFYTNGDSVDIDDIIVYHSWTVGVYTGYMWIGHRVIEKFKEGDTWHFRTKGDNCPDPDGWTVPEYAILGIVVGIEHTERKYEHMEKSSQTERRQETHPDTPSAQWSETFLLIAGFCLGAAIAVFNYLRRRREPREHTPNPDQSTRIHPIGYHRELARRYRMIRRMREIKRLRQLSSMRRIMKEDGKTLVRNWRNSIMGLIKLADRNLKAAKGHLESKNHRLAVETASTAVENMARALIHCYGGKPDLGPGQEEPLRMLSVRFKGEEKAEFERAIHNITRISHSRIAQRYISRHEVQIQLVDETLAKEILESTSNVVDLFKRILTDHFAAEIPELQYETCPKCHSLDIWTSVFDQFTVNYQCIRCRFKWTGPRRYIQP